MRPVTNRWLNSPAGPLAPPRRGNASSAQCEVPVLAGARGGFGSVISEIQFALPGSRFISPLNHAADLA